MNNLSLRLLGCSLILLLAACVPPSGWPPVRGDSAPLPSRAEDLVELLDYYQELESKPEAALQQERRFYQAALVADRCSSERMRLGLVLLRLNEVGRPSTDVDQIMPPCLLDAGDGRGIHLLAQLIHHQLLTTNRLLARQQDSSQTLEALKRDNQELRRQVDGLRAIERSLQNRRQRE